MRSSARGDSRSRPGRMVLTVVVVLLAAAAVAGCGDDDDGSSPTALPTRLRDPCQLVSTAQLRQELGVDLSTRSAGDDPPEGEDATELSCSWFSVDPESEPSEEYLQEEVPAFVDVVVRRSDPEAGVDGDELWGGAAVHPAAVDVPELVATEADATLADAATAVGGTLFVLKGDVLLTVSTESSDSLNRIIPGVIVRLVRGI